MKSRKKLAEELKIYKERLEKAMDGGNLAWWEMYLPSGKIKFNERKAHILGYEPANFKHYEDFTDLVHPADYARTMQAMKDHLDGKKPRYEVEYRIRTKDGNYKWFRDIGQMSKLKNSDDNIVLTGIVIDISSRKEIETDRNKKSKELETIFNQANDAIYFHKLENNNSLGNFINVNESAIKMLGYSKQELLNMSPKDIDAADINTTKIIKKLINKGTLSFETIHKTKDGTLIPVELNSHVFELGNNKRILTVARDIRKRKEAFRKIKKSEQELSAIYKNAPMVMMLLDEDRKVRKINAYGAKFANASEEEIIGLTGGEAIKCLNHLDDPRGCGFGPNCENCTVRSTVVETFETGESREMVEAKLPFSIDGERKYLTFLLSTSLIKMEDEQLVLASFLDITARKSVEEKLRKSEEKFRSFVENANNIVYSLNPSGIFTYASPNWKEILGHDPKEVVGRSFKEFVHPEDIPSNQAFLEKVIKSGQKQSGAEYRVKHKDGNWRWHLSNASPMKNGDGEVISFLGVAYDITERKETEEKLRLQKEQFELAVLGSNDGIWDWNIEQDSLFLSSRWKEQLGFENDEFNNTFEAFANRIHPEDRQRVMEYIESYFKGTESKYDIEFRMQHKNGDYRWIRARGEALQDKNGKPYRMAGSHTDITERKKYERILKEKTHALSERVKELNCLYELSKLIEKDDSSLTEIYKEVVSIIPPALQYPSITCARLDIDGNVYTSQNYKKTKWQLSSDIYLKNEKYGELTVNYLKEKREEDIGPFLQEEKDLLKAIAERLGRTIERRMVEEKLSQYRRNLEKLVKIRSRKLKKSMQRLSQIEEKMRKNAAKKLHDQVGQNLSALKLNINFLETLLPQETRKKLQNRIDDSLNLLEETIDHITNIMTELRPPLLQDYGFFRALRTFTEQFYERTGIKVELPDKELENRLPDNIEIAVFRVIQELFNNISKHSRAKKVDINFEQSQNSIKITISDDGVGFDPQKARDKKHSFGIMTMRERLNIINGSLDIKSSPGQGTTTEIKIEEIEWQ